MYTCSQTHGISYSELSHCWWIELSYGQGEKKTQKSSSAHAHITLGMVYYKQLCIGRGTLIYESCAVTVCSVWIRIFITIVFDVHWHPWDGSRALSISAYLKLQQLSPSFVPGDLPLCDLFQEVVLMLTLTSDLPLCGKTDGAIIKQYNAKCST